jgi:hypothetical protein
MEENTHTLSRGDAEGAAAVGHRHGVVLALVAAAVLTVGLHAMALARSVVNLPMTAVAVVWANVHDADCSVQDDLTVACADMTGGYVNAATTVGNVWLYGELDGADRHRHESRHSDQWAMFGGGPTFPALYGAESLRTRGDFYANVFERWAGLHDGGYR